MFSDSPSMAWALPVGILAGLALGVVHVTLGLWQSLVVFSWILVGALVAWIAVQATRGRFNLRAALRALLQADRP